MIILSPSRPITWTGTDLVSFYRNNKKGPAPPKEVTSLDLRLALVQFPRTDDRERNIRRMAGYLADLAGADIVLLPENWLGPQVIPWPEYLAIALELAALAPSGSLLVSGAQYVEISGTVYSRGLFLPPDQTAVPFEKHFPSQAVGERGFVAPGRHLPVVEYRGVRLGAVVCVDLVYPELVRRLALAGAQVVLNPANIPASRLELWRALGMARAAENTIFVAMANNTGSGYGDGRPVTGGSFVALPYGLPLDTAGPAPGIHYFSLDLAQVNQARRRWPYLADINNIHR